MMLKKFFIPVTAALFLAGCQTTDGTGRKGYVGIQTYPLSKQGGDTRFYSKKPADSGNIPSDDYYYKKYSSGNASEPQKDAFRGISGNEEILRRNIINTAEKYLGVRYRYGGSSPKGFDCSGFALYVYKQNGINLPRSASAQYRAGNPLNNGKAKPGDLVFFSDKGTKITHVGIYLGNNSFIHAPSTGKTVEITELDSAYYNTRLAGYVSFIN